MLLDYAPRKQLAEWLMNGWSPVEGHEYNPNDYAYLLQKDGIERTSRVAFAIIERIAPERIPEPRQSNLTRARIVANRSRKWFTGDPVSKQRGLG